MSIKPGIYAYLKTVTDVTDIVGTGNSARIYEHHAPNKATHPHLVYQRISGGHEHHLTAGAGVARDVFQLTAVDNDGVNAEALRDAVREGMDGYRGSMGSANVRRCHLRNETERFVQPTDSSEVGRFLIHMDFEIDWLESVPTF